MTPPHTVTSDLIEIVAMTISWALTTAASFVLIIRDERHMRPETLAKAWTPVSRDCALIAFGQFAVFVHYMRTRWNVRGLLLGLGAVVLVTLPSLIFELAFDLIFPTG